MEWRTVVFGIETNALIQTVVRVVIGIIALPVASRRQVVATHPSLDLPVLRRSTCRRSLVSLGLRARATRIGVHEGVSAMQSP